MTRSHLRRKLNRIYLLLGLIVTVALLAKLADLVPGVKGSTFGVIAKDLYEVIRDTSLLLATGGVAYITNAFQQRSNFIDALKAEWHDIVGAKSALLIYLHKDDAQRWEYVETYTRLSETIDNMRSVYRNVGETEGKIGLYPFAPLHDMRRVLQSLDPKNGPTTAQQRKVARDTMLASFYALRDVFLDELDLEMPDASLLIAGARRLKKPGAEPWAARLQAIQQQRQARAIVTPGEEDRLLAELYAKEKAKAELPPQTGSVPGLSAGT